nr:lipopolysaccharide biosynthesis protein [uncultured Lichenicoccus sp.]
MLGRRTALSGVLLIGARLFSRLIDLVTMLILARLLQPKDFGLVAIAMTVISVAEVVLELNVAQVLMRSEVLTRSQLDTAFTLSVIRGLAMGIVILGSAWPLASLYSDQRLVALVAVLSLSPILRGLRSPRLVEYQRAMSFWRDTVTEVGGKVAAIAVALGVGLITHDYWALVAGTVSFPATMIVISYALAPYRPRLSLVGLRRFLDYLGWLTGAQVISAVNWQFERLLMGRLVSFARLGLFTTASDLTSIPLNAIIGPIIGPLMAAFSAVRDDPPRLLKIYQNASAAVMTLGLPILVGECLLSDPIVHFVFGAKWLGAIPLLRGLSLSVIPGLLALGAAPLMMSFGDTRFFVKKNAIELLVKLPLVILGALKFGFMGVIGARVVSEFAAAAYAVNVVRRTFDLSILRQILNIWRSVAGVMVMTPVVLLADHLQPFGSDVWAAGPNLVIAASLGGIAYATALAALWFATGRPAGLEAMVLNGLINRLHRNKQLRQPERAL